jgi:hypothetical protein
LTYQVGVCQLNNLEVNPEWIGRIEQSIADTVESFRFYASYNESPEESDLDLSRTTMFNGCSRGGDIVLNELQGDPGDNRGSNVASPQKTIKLLRDLVEQLVCDDSPEARMACEKLHDALALICEVDQALLIRPFEQSSISPLSSITSSGIVNQLLRDFNTFRMNATNNPETVHTLAVSSSQLRQVRNELALLSLNDEKGLHVLAGLLCHRYLGKDITIEAQVQMKNVLGENEDSSSLLKQVISRCELFSRSDIEIAESISGRSAQSLGASVIEYRSSSGKTDGAVHAIRTRIKAWESLSDKIVDRMFDGNTITDLSGIAIVVDTEDDVRNVYGQLARLRWSDAELKVVGLQPSDTIRRLDIFKTSDKLGLEHINWRGIKVAGFWGNQCVEIQIKTVDFLRREQASNTPESHSAYRRDREKRRERNARSVPMYDFSRDFIKFALLGGGVPANLPTNVRLDIVSS